MVIRGFKRLFDDNAHYGQYAKIPFLDSLAYVVQEYLYTDISEDEDPFLMMDGRIRLYDFMTMSAYFISASANDLGKATIKDFLADIHQHERYQTKHDIIEYTAKESITIQNASSALTISILWANYIYAKARYKRFAEIKWERISKMLYGIMLEEYVIKEEYFKDIPAIKFSEEATDLMIQHIEQKMKENDTIEEHKKNISEKQKIQTKVEAENKLLSEKNEVLEAENKRLSEKNKQLEEENGQLSKENEELKEIKMIMDTPLDAIEADSKVGLTEILKLMENDGANFVKHNNKTIAAKALKMMTGRSESACKQIFSSPLSPTYSGHKNKISELNGYLKALGMKTLL